MAPAVVLASGAWQDGEGLTSSGLAKRVFGAEQGKFMLDRRGGLAQMDADRGKWKL